jgi:Putative lumazine-binding
MKTTIAVAVIVLALGGGIMNVTAQTSTKNTTDADRKKSAEAAVIAFAKAADERNIAALTKLMHENYNAMARMPGATTAEPIIESRAQYFSLIEKGRIGGKPRTISIQSVDVWNNTAVVRAELESAALHFSSTFSLFYSPEMGWQLVHDLVELHAKGK